MQDDTLHFGNPFAPGPHAGDPLPQPPVSPWAIAAAIGPLRMVFWGAILCVFDFYFSSTTNGRGFRFDILNDAVGCLLVALGVFRLRAAPIAGPYRGVMTFVGVVSLVSMAEAIREHIITPWGSGWALFGSVLGVAELAATLLFCIAMTWFCQQALMTRAEKSWQVTTLLFVIIYIIPLGLLQLAGFFAIMTSNKFHYNIGPLALLLLPVFAAPLIHFFVSTSRMKREAEERAANARVAATQATLE